MSTNKMSGNLIGLQIDGNFIDCEVSCEFSFDTEMLPASAISSGRWKEFISGVRSWSVTINAMMLMRMSGTGFNTILNAFMTGEKMAIRIQTKHTDEIPSFAIIGNVRLQNGGFNATVNTLASWNATLQGDGSFSTEINDNIVYAISTIVDNTEALQDGNGNLIVSSNNQNQ